MKFTVCIKEVHYSYRDVTASTWREAVKKAQDGDYDHEYVEYSHTLDNAPIDVKPCDPDIAGHDTDDYAEASDEEKDRVRKWECGHDSFRDDCDSCEELRIGE